MPVTRLALTDFRSYPSALIKPGPGFVLLSGDNGAGKTNLLEAVSLLSPGRGLRGAALSEMARNGGAGGFAVSARLGDVEIGTGTLPTAPERRQVRLNSAAASVNSLSPWPLARQCRGACMEAGRTVSGNLALPLSGVAACSPA